MIPLIEQHQDAIRALCKKYGVKTLTLFGSAARGEYVNGKSDLDFFVEFGKVPEGMDRADQYFDFLFGLEDLFHTRIDLVEKLAITNPYFLPVAEEHQDSVYAA